MNRLNVDLPSTVEREQTFTARAFLRSFPSQRQHNSGMAANESIEAKKKEAWLMVVTDTRRKMRLRMDPSESFHRLRLQLQLDIRGVDSMSFKLQLRVFLHSVGEESKTGLFVFVSVITQKLKLEFPDELVAMNFEQIIREFESE